MKNKITRSEWEDIPGFDPVKEKYIRLDCDNWIADQKIREEGEKRGKQNQPDSDEPLPDAFYRKIESWVSKRALVCKEEVSKYINDKLAYLHEIKSSWEKENPEINISALVNRRCADLKNQVTQNLSDLNKQCTEYEESNRELKKFREQHNLLRVAEYPINKFAHWLWVPVAMIVESFVSANLLGSVSRGGVIEGWMIAFALTLVNVLLGLWVGHSWRYTQYDRGFKKLIAYAQCIFSSALALIWNNIAGHVRDVYVNAEKTGQIDNLDKAFAEAWQIMIINPIPWESLASAGLAFVGVAVFALSAYKFYTADDPFPGYGPRHRKVEDLLERYQNSLNHTLKELKIMRNRVNEDIDEFKSRYELDRASWKIACDKLSMLVKDYSVNLRQYNKDLAYIIAAYRDANLATRTTPAPKYFNNESKIDEDVIVPPEFVYPNPPEWGDIEQEAKTAFQKIEETYKELSKRFEMLDHLNADRMDVS